MTERSSSHKSDGRQSSAGQSTQSARASSFGFEPRPLSAAVAPFVPLGPPPGIFMLGPVPSIIRCWLDTKFSNESLLYAVVCTGSFKSVLTAGLASRLGVEDQITTNHKGERVLKMQVYLPEATIQQQSSSRANSPAPQLPMLTVEFSIQSSLANSEAIQVFIGSDVLRARNADLQFSLDRITLYDDDRNKLSVPLARPENASAFQCLRTTNFDFSKLTESKDDQPNHTNNVHSEQRQIFEPKVDLASKMQDQCSDQIKAQPPSMVESTPVSSPPSVIGEGRKSIEDRENGNSPIPAKSNTKIRESETLTNGNTPETPTKVEGGNIWGSWRRDAMQNGRQDLGLPNSTTISGYQRAGRGRGMKVLKPARLNTGRGTSATHPPTNFDAVMGRTGEAGKSGGQSMNENQSNASSAIDPKSASSDARTPLPPLSNKPRSANPIGGASAFPWLNSGEQKQSTNPSE